MKTRGIDTIAGTDPFMMQADGKGWLFAPSGLLDGPLPAHYEPQESVLENPFTDSSPTRPAWSGNEGTTPTTVPSTTRAFPTS